MNASASNLISIAADLNAKGKEVTIKRLRTRGPRKGETMQRSNGYGHLTGVGSVRGADGQTASHATGAGKGGTITRVTGLGKEMVRDLSAVKRKASAQYKADRRAFVLGL